MTLQERVSAEIRDIMNFPKDGIVFKDITPVLQNPQLCREIINYFHDTLKDKGFDCVAAVESRGFLFGMPIAQSLNLPFVPIRKKGKLPHITFSERYDLEYGSAEIEMHTDAIREGAKVLLHDDLLATGGTVMAAARLIKKAGGTVHGFSFLITLEFLGGREKIAEVSKNIFTLERY